MIRIAAFIMIILHSTLGFAYLNDPHIIQSMDYATDHNFIGRKIAQIDLLKILTKLDHNSKLIVNG